MPGPNSAPNGNARLVNGARIRVCSIHGRHLQACAKAKDARCKHSFRTERTYLSRGRRLDTGKTARRKR